MTKEMVFKNINSEMLLTSEKYVAMIWGIPHRYFIMLQVKP